MMILTIMHNFTEKLLRKVKIIIKITLTRQHSNGMAMYSHAAFRLPRERKAYFRLKLAFFT
jgi:hypothetical protein